jgi:hypothetical protein
VRLALVDSTFVIPGWSEGPDPESRDSGLALRAPRNDVSTSAHFASHPRLSTIGRVALLLLLAHFLLPGVVAAVEAAGDGAEHTMMTGVVAGDAADRRAFQAAPGVGGIRGQREGCDGKKNGK